MAIAEPQHGDRSQSSESATSEVARRFYPEHGEPIIDLNALVLPGSDLTLVSASFINERGEIAGGAIVSNGDTRAILLIRCDRDHADFEGCDGYGRHACNNYNRPNRLIKRSLTTRVAFGRLCDFHRVPNLHRK
jgi:hypothetical protein